MYKRLYEEEHKLHLALPHTVEAAPGLYSSTIFMQFDISVKDCSIGVTYFGKDCISFTAYIYIYISFMALFFNDFYFDSFLRSKVFLDLF